MRLFPGWGSRKANKVSTSESGKVNIVDEIKTELAECSYQNPE